MLWASRSSCAYSPGVSPMRSSRDLIVELNSEAEHFTAVAVAVGFPYHTEFVFSGGEGSIARLDELIRDGGEPVGLLSILQSEDFVQVKARPLAEYANEIWVQAYLQSVANSLRNLLSGKGAGELLGTGREPRVRGQSA